MSENKIKLLYSPRSPFVRKVMVYAMELGVDGRIEKVDATVSPLDIENGVTPVNPLGKVPTVILPDGRAIFDSRVICEYLATLAPAAAALPDGIDRWDDLTAQAMGDGLLDAGLAARYESQVRPEDKRWSDWYSGQFHKLLRCVDAMERSPLISRPHGTIGQIAMACGLGYLDFRFGSHDWRSGHPKTEAWYAGFSQRPSMLKTAPSL